MLEFFASVEAGQAVLRPAAVDVRDVLTAALDADEVHGLNGHVITRRVARDTPLVMADPHWLRRSVEELVDNAVKFSPTGGRVTVTAGPADAGMVEISIRDNGVGMTADELERAFAEWAQGDESDTRAYSGLGLGLALVQRVAERHGGRISCQSEPRKGSKFSILVPAVPTDEGDASRRRSRASRLGRGRRTDDGGVRDSEAGTRSGAPDPRGQ
jgi:signal transduction histidine kinase